MTTKTPTRPITKLPTGPLDFARCPYCRALIVKSDALCAMCGLMLIKPVSYRLSRWPVYLALATLAVLLAACILYIVRYH